MGNRITILGAGFIGKNLLNSYVRTGDAVSVLDHKPRPAGLPDNIDWIEGSFASTADVGRAIRGADVVYHLISSTVPGDSADENDEILNNVVQTINLLKLCVQEKVRRVVFISSASVYGIKEKLPISESDATDPISSHGIHKLTIEKYLQLYRYKYGLDCKIIRLSNPYGRGQNVFGRQGFVAISIGKILTNEVIKIIGDGSAIRDFIYIEDVIDVCRLVAATSSEEIVFNIGSGAGITINQVIEELQNVVQTALTVVHVESRINDISASIMDIRKASDVLGFEPSISFREGLKLTLLAYMRDFPGCEERFNLRP